MDDLSTAIGGLDLGAASRDCVAAGGLPNITYTSQSYLFGLFTRENVTFECKPKPADSSSANSPGSENPSTGPSAPEASGDASSNAGDAASYEGDGGTEPTASEDAGNGGGDGGGGGELE